MSWNKIKIHTPHLEVKDIDLNFFKERKNGQNVSGERIISIFGRNGSGKTTISNALLQASLKNIEAGEETNPIFLRAYTENNNVVENCVSLDQEEKSNLCVYNEKFVDKYVRVEENENLEAIVMLSDDPDLRTILSKFEERKNSVDQQIDNAKQALQRFESDANSQNETNIRKKLKDSLKSRGDGHQSEVRFIIQK
ncbi:AAA family ATPase [Latilactobacillus sakei]|uniref:AAA family ATPase n=1 Tax=Latilactobacillus sakei TaxID=1599 RepID=UPI00388710BC